MDPRLLDYYNSELLHVRETAAELANARPKIAGRLALDGAECSDPYVERLLEGFAFLAARVQLKIDSEFPTFTQHLLEMVFPGFLAPVPSMAVVRFEPDLAEAGLAQGVEVPRGSVLRARPSSLPGATTACEFRTAHGVKLWPIELAEAKYLAYPPELPRELQLNQKLQAAIRLRLRATAGLNFDAIALERLRCTSPATRGWRRGCTRRCSRRRWACWSRPPPPRRAGSILPPAAKCGAWAIPTTRPWCRRRRAPSAAIACCASIPPSRRAIFSPRSEGCARAWRNAAAPSSTC